MIASLFFLIKRMFKRKSKYPEIKTISAPTHHARGMSVIYEPKVKAICSVTKVPFKAKVRITYKVQDRYLEFESVDAWLRSLRHQKITIEDLCRFIYSSVRYALMENKPGLTDLPDIQVCLYACTVVHAPASVCYNSEMEKENVF